MCTLTWTHRAAGEVGYSLYFNRDELRTRGPEVPPAITERDGVRYIAPTDSDAGGTWIAVNEFGVTVALLNGYIDSKGPARDEWTSRGELVRSLADVRNVVAAWRRLTPRALEVYRPSVVVVVAERGPALYSRWDGRTLELDGIGERRLPVTSSSYETSEVVTSRAALYREFVGDAACPGADRLMAFQNHVGEDGPTAFSPTMGRPDAATRSQCRIDVDATRVTMTYVPGPPHETAPLPPLVLERALR